MGEPQTFTQSIPGITQIANSSGTLYIERTPSGQPLSMQTGTGSTVPNYDYVPGGLGSIINLVPANTTSTTTAGATPVAAYSYAPYGTVTATTNPAGGTLTVANANPLHYTGAYQDAKTKLIHLGARWYDPHTARFTQQDGITHLTNLTQGNRYAYAADDPENNQDPSGNGIFGDIAGGIGGVAAGLGLIGGTLMVGGDAGFAFGSIASIGATLTIGAGILGVVGGAALIGYGIYEATS